MNTIKFSESNKWAIHDAFLLNQDNRIIGTKLQALSILISKKGEVLNIGKEKIKCLHIGGGTYVSMVITHCTKDSFFPCKIRKIHIQKL